MLTSTWGKHVRSVFGYGMTSIGAGIVDLTILHTAISLRFPAPLAVTVGFFSGVAFQFNMLRHVVFKAQDRPVARQAGAFLTTIGVSWVAAVCLVALLSNTFHLPTVASRAITLPLLFPFNYLVNTLVTFRGNRIVRAVAVADGTADID